MRFFTIDRILKGTSSYHAYLIASTSLNNIFSYHGLDVLEYKFEKARKISGLFKNITVINESPNQFIDCYSIDNYSTNSWNIKKRTETIENYSQEFITENNMVSTARGNNIPSKKLGKSSIEDNLSNFLYTLTNDMRFQLDNEGLDLTRKLLGNNPTFGTDVDFYDSTTNTVYEFLNIGKGQTVNPITSHPMRYCWNKSSRDNRHKFISIYNLCKFLKSSLIFVNYTDFQTDSSIVKLIVSPIINEMYGFISDVEVVMTVSEFREFIWISDSNVRLNYLKDHYHTKIYSQNFSDNSYKSMLQNLSNMYNMLK